MHLIFDHMPQFKHINHTYCSRLVKSFTGTAVMKICYTVHRQFCLLGIFSDLVDGGSVEDRSGKLQTKFLTCPSEDSFIDLSKVHSRRYTERIKNNINRCSVLEERHIFLTDDPCNDTFITMTSCHLITYFHLPFFGDIYFRET